MIRLFRRGLLAAFAVLFVTAPAFAADFQVAVAANFTEPAKEIAAAFKRATGKEAGLAFGASGAFYTQITQGAPFDVFLSADPERPMKAESDGVGVPGTRFTYAIGRLVLYSTQPGLVDDGGRVLARGNFNKISIADPAAAPYGAAAVQTMTKMRVYTKLARKIVKGGSIAQAYLFVSSGAAELGFVALSQVINQQGGSRWLVPMSMHKPINQQAILLFNGAKKPEAVAFLKFLRGAEARAIIKRYGYETP